MNSARKFAVIMLLCTVAGCKHKPPPAPPQTAQAPILPPGDMVQGQPPPTMPPPEAPKVNPPGSDEAKQPPPKPKPKRRKPKPADTTPATGTKDAPATTPGPSVASAAPAESSEVSPIGQLSTAGDNSTLPTRHTILDKITATENGLNGIKRSLTAEEQVTATQIRTFLTKARKALDQDDLDGALTLVTKAEVLLTELTKT